MRTKLGVPRASNGRTPVCSPFISPDAADAERRDEGTEEDDAAHRHHCHLQAREQVVLARPSGPAAGYVQQLVALQLALYLRLLAAEHSAIVVHLRGVSLVFVNDYLREFTLSKGSVIVHWNYGDHIIIIILGFELDQHSNSLKKRRLLLKQRTLFLIVFMYD